MGFFFKEKRGPDWKQGWTNQTIASISPPPLPLLALFGIVFLFLTISYYTHYKAQIHKTSINFNLLLFLLPVLLILLARNISFNRPFSLSLPSVISDHDSIHRAGGSPWGVAAVVVLLLVMVSYQSSFQSKWFRPFWSSYYY